MVTTAQMYGRGYSALRSELGRVAAAEGWIIQLFDFVMANGRPPNVGEEIDGCRALAAKIAAAKPEWPAVARLAHNGRIARFERIAHGLE